MNNISCNYILPNVVGIEAYTNFFMNVSNSICNISSASGSVIYDYNQNIVSSLELSKNAYTNIKLVSKNNNWYLVDYTYNNEITYFNNKINTPTISNKTGGINNLLVATFTTSINNNLTYTFNVPISVYRNGTNDSRGNQTQHFETLNAITAYYTKNGVFGDNLNVSTNNTLPTTKQFNHISPSFNYEQYYTNALVSILPSITNTTDTYNIYFNISSSYTVNFADIAGTISGYYINTNLSTTWSGVSNTFFITASGTNYSSASYSNSIDNLNYPTSDLSVVQANCFNSNSLLTKSIISNNITTNTIISNNIIINWINYYIFKS